MPPKFKFSKDEIIDQAVEITRKDGESALTARTLASRLGVSVKPLFVQFSGMDEIRRLVIERANALYSSCIFSAMQEGKYPAYKASGMAYIEFAKTETELFKLLFMRDRKAEPPVEDRESIRDILNLLTSSLGISEDEAYLMHLEMWVFVHGVATMIATSYLDWDTEFVSRALSDVYYGLKTKFTRSK